MRRTRAPEHEPEPAGPGGAPPVAAPRAAERILALQRAAGNQAVARALLLRAPPDPPKGVSASMADPLPAGATTADPGHAKVSYPGKDEPQLPGGWKDPGGEAKSGVVGHVDRILLEGLPGNQSQQEEGQPGAPSHDPRYADTAGSGPAGARGRAIALIPEAVKKGKGGEIAVLVHLHGIYEALRERNDQPRDVKHYQVEQQLEAFLAGRAGTQMIGLLPIGVQVGQPKHTVSYGNLNVDALIAAAFGQLGKELPSGAKPGDVVMSAHSGGGFPLGSMLASGEGLPARLRGVFLFEAFHGDVANHIGFIKERLETDLNVLELTRKQGGGDEAEIFAAQATYLEEGMRVVAFGGAKDYARVVTQIRDAILTWWDKNSARIVAATGGRSELIDALWMHYQAQTIVSDHENALAGAKTNLGRALATLPQSVGGKRPPPVKPVRTPALARDFKKETYTLSDTPVTVVPESRKKKRALITDAPSSYANEILNAVPIDPAKWFSSFTTISFLGRPVSDPVHTDLATHLQAVEKTLADKYGGGDPKKAGDAFNLKESMPGARHAPTSAAVSMHLFGLAIDVNYTTNPYISESANPVFKNAGTLLGEATTGYSNGMSYDDLSALDARLERYFKLLDDDAAVDARIAAKPPAPFAGLDRAGIRKLIQADLDLVAGKWERTGKKQKPEIKAGGFLDMDKRLVDEIGLDWGGKTYGDMMHFDMRNKGNGAAIQKAANEYKTRKDAESAAQWEKDHPDGK